MADIKTYVDNNDNVQTIYSKGSNYASFYAWEDPKNSGKIGYFVSLNEETCEIDICNGPDIFGVTVDCQSDIQDVGFAGGYDTVAMADKKYEAVVIAGCVDVICETDVEVGDYVVSNNDGMAKKTDPMFGYKVVAIDEIGVLHCARIMLTIQADKTDMLGQNIKVLDDRLDAVEANIVSAINMASLACAKVGIPNDLINDLNQSVEGSNEIANDALDKANDAFNKANSAIDFGNAAINQANQAIVSTVQLRNEFDAKINNMDGRLNSAASELTNVKGDIEAIQAGMQGTAGDVSEAFKTLREEFTATTNELDERLDAATEDLQTAKNDIISIKNGMQGDVGDASEEFKKLRDQLEPLATWPPGATGDDITGIAGFVADATENGAVLAGLTSWKDGTGVDSLSGYVSKATADNAEIQGLASYSYTDDNGVWHSGASGIMAEVDKNKAAISAIANFDGDIAGFQAQVDAVSASVTTLASHIIGDYVAVDTWDASKAVQGTIYYAKDTQLYWYYDGGWQSTDKPSNVKPALAGTLAGIKQTADDNKASIEMITSFEGEFGKSIAGFISEATAEDASIKALAQYNGGAAGLIAQVEANKVSIDTLAKLEGDGYEGLAGMTAQVDANAANITTLASYTVGDYITVDTWSISGKNESSVYYAKDEKKYYYYKNGQWVGTTNLTEAGLTGALAGVQQTADANAATLNAMASYEGNVGDKTVAAMAGMLTYVDKNSAQIKNLASYERKDKDGNVIGTGAAGLMAQVDANTSSLKLVAELEGVDFNSLAGLQADVTNNSAAITTLASHIVGDYITVDTWNASTAETNKVYYAKDTKKYYYYKNTSWIDTTKAYEAGLQGTLSGIQQVADNNHAQLSAMVSYDKDGKSALAGLTTYVDDNSAHFSELAKYEYKQGDKVITSGIAGLVTQVTSNAATIDSLVKLEDGDFTGLAGMAAQVTQNAADVSLVSKYVQGTYIVISELVDEDQRDPSEIYYDSKEAKYWYKQGGNWTSTSSWPSSIVDQNTKYYVVGTGLYWYWEPPVDEQSGHWSSTYSAYDAGLPASIGGIQVVTDKNSSIINSLTSWQGETRDAMARIEQKADATGAYIQTTVANIDRYSVGPYSQSYNFTAEQAKVVLASGTVYVPTYTHTEEVPFNQEFTQYYYYTWNGTQWEGSNSNAVFHTNIYPAGSAPYWYIPGPSTVINGDDVYYPYTLYKWESSQWVAVAIYDDNFQSRAVSQIRQDTNNIELNVTNIKGDLASIKTWAGDDFAAIQDVVSWKSDNKDSIEALATTVQKASDAEAYIAQVASVKNPDGTVNAAASIVTAVKDDASAITMLADNIVLDASKITINGDTTFTTIDDNGVTKINGGHIDGSSLRVAYADVTGHLEAMTGTIAEFNIGGQWGSTSVAGLWYGDKGQDSSFWLLPTGYFSGLSTNIAGHNRSDWSLMLGTNFGVTKTGNLYANNAEITGTITAEGGQIGGFTIGGQWGSTSVAGLWYGDKGQDSSFWLLPTGQLGGFGTTIAGNYRTDWSLMLGTDFGVTKSGNLYANNAEITGKITANSGTIGKWNIDSNGLYSTDNNGNAPNIFLDSAGRTAVVVNNGTATETSNLAIRVGQNFGVSKDGTVYASSANITGNINATSGNIGGWDVGSTSLVNYDGTQDASGYYPNSFCMRVKTGAGGAALAIGKARENNWSNAAFRVTADGKLYAEDLNSKTVTMYCTDDALSNNLTNGDIGFNSEQTPEGYYQGLTGHVRVPYTGLNGILGYFNLYFCNGIIVGIGNE